jgi:uncharacterized protein YndB with AHSA1/START domain
MIEDTFGERIADDTVRFRRHFRAPVERVWQALISPEGIAGWLGRPIALEAREGGEFEIAFNDEDRMKGRVLAIETNRLLVLAWREEFDGVPSGHATKANDESVVTFAIEAKPDGGTVLDFTHRYIREGEKMISFGAGWHAHLDVLGAFVQGDAAVDLMARYHELRPTYAARLGPDRRERSAAATSGSAT